MKTESYNAEHIEILEDLSPILHRPGMYTDPANPNHALIEIIDNAVDEGIAGYARSVEVDIHEDGSASVADDGRGIPIDLHPKKKVPAVEVIFSSLHSGGKFRKTDRDTVYRIAGGLHGVGVCVSNALSTKLIVEVKRDGLKNRLVFGPNGKIKHKLRAIGKVKPRDTGTFVRFWPDKKYFETVEFDATYISNMLKAKAMLLPGVNFFLNVEKDGKWHREKWQFKEGIQEYFSVALQHQACIMEPLFGERYVETGQEDESFSEGEGASWALTWTSEGETFSESFVNMIPTRHGGTHVAGMRDGVFNSIKNFIDLHGLGQKGIKIVPDDVWSRVSYVLACKVLDPQFKGQVKNELISRDALKLTSQMIRDPIELWLNQHVNEGKVIADLAIRQAVARTRKTKAVNKRKNSTLSVLPGKLTDCATEDPERNELFIVEGDSAGGSAKAARDKEFQAILPLKGKPKNTWQDSAASIYTNKEIEAIALAIGVSHHSTDDDVSLSGLRYHRINILADADVDGSHIQVLLLTLFFKHFPKLILNNHIFVSQPPLFRIDVPKLGKSKSSRKFYATDQAELEAIEQRLTSEGYRENVWTVSRFKGLGEMSPQQLWETTLNPDTRRVMQVSLEGSGEHSHEIFEMLMSRDNAPQRKRWMEDFGSMVDSSFS